MKNLIFYLFFVVTLMKPFDNYGQFLIYPSTGNNFTQTDQTSDIESVGIGDFANAGFYPASALHINTNYFTGLPNPISYSPASFGEVFRTDCPNDLVTYWRMFRGATLYGNIWNNGDNHFIVEAPVGNLLLNSQGTGTSATSIERMRLSSGPGGNSTGGWDNTNDGTEVIINRRAGSPPMFFPQANLNIGSDLNSYASGGRRPWQEVGTYYNFDSDHMYTGLLDMGNNRKDAVVNFGDDPAHNGEASTQNLRFIFTQYPHLSGTTDPYDGRRTQGLEIARMAADGNVGIGSLFTTTLQPVRRLEVVDDNANHYNHTGSFQMRLSNVQSTPGSILTTGIWTDLNTSSAGNFTINPRITGVNGNVGINTTAAPGATLEINSNTALPTTAGGASGSTGNSGLMFQDLTTASTPLSTSPWPSSNRSVLSVDATGKVILVKDDNSGGTLTGLCTAGFTNFVSKHTATLNQLSCSQIFDDATTVGIGTGTGVFSGSPMPVAPRLQVVGELYLQNLTTGLGASGGDIWMNEHNSGLPFRAFSMYGGSGLGVISIGNDAGNNAGTGAVAASSVNGSIFIGNSAGAAIGSSNANFNILIGDLCADAFVGGTITDSYNVLMGAECSRSLTSGYRNTFLGSEAAPACTTGVKNTAVGHHAGAGYYSGDRNTFLGADGFLSVNGNAGDDNVMIGAGANATVPGLGAVADNAMSVGTDVYVRCSDCANISNIDQQVGIGVETPSGIPTGAGSAMPGEAKLYVANWTGTNGISTYFDGRICALATLYPSDAMLKDNIQDFTGALDLISQITPKTYTYNQNIPTMNLPVGNQIGLLAQNVETVLPALVHDIASPAKADAQGNIIPSQGFKGIDYAGLVPVLLQGMKEMQSRLDSLSAVVAACCAAPRFANPENNLAIELSNNESIILDQNVPNPFAEKTIINYSIPESVLSAKIIFFNLNGKILKTYTIEHKGAGSLTIYGENLSSGSYSYSLIADDKLIETKKMIKQ
jgi:hypothetical protein